MSEDKLLKKFEDMLIANNDVLLNAMDKKIQTSEKRIKEEITQKLSKQIELSQEDTINVLSELIHTGYDMHEDRIKRIENELHLPPLKQN